MVLLIGGIAALQWWGFIQQILLGKPWGNKPTSDWMMVLLWLTIGIGLPLLFLTACLIVIVTREAVLIHYRPFMKRTVPLADITKATARTYSPLREFGGWGLRGWGARKAYNVSGNRGVELTLQDGSTIMIGSQRADELEQAILSAQGKPI
jgi:hypothetical protein